MRAKFPRIDWDAPGIALPLRFLAGDDFETYEAFELYGAANGPRPPLAGTWTLMESGDPKGTATEQWSCAIGGYAGSLGAFSGYAAYRGRQAVNLTLGYHPASVTSRSIWLRRVFPGLPASTAVEVSCICGWGYETGSPPATAPIGIRVEGGAPVTHTLGQQAVAVTANAVTTAAGTLEVDIGVFGLAGTDGVFPLQRRMVWDSVTICLAASAAPNTRALLFAAPLDAARAFNVPRQGSSRRPGVRSHRFARVAMDELLQGTARWIPELTGVTKDGRTATGWYGTDLTTRDGWQDFLVIARDGQPFTFYPDQDDLATSYVCELVEPRHGPQEPEGAKHFRLPLVFRSHSGPFLGY